MKIISRVTATFFLCVLLISCVDIFPVERILLAEVKSRKGVEYKAYLVATGASSEDAVVITVGDKEKKALKSYVGYFAASLSLVDDERLVVTLPLGDNKVKIDTIIISNVTGTTLAW